MPIRFHYQGVRIHWDHRNILKGFLQELLTREGRTAGTLDYIFCTDRYLLGLNKTYLNHATLTDILTFDLGRSSNEGWEAEIYISFPRVRENARTYEVPLRQELLRVILHGALHLCGYQDKKPRDQQIMHKMEDHYLQIYLLIINCL